MSVLVLCPCYASEVLVYAKRCSLLSKQESLFMLQLSTSCFSPNDDVLIGNTVVREIFVLKYFRGLGLPALPDSHERLLLLVLRTKVSPLGPVNRPCVAGIAVEPFGRAQLCCVYIYVDCTTCYYSLLKIFRAINFRGLSQPQKYFNNENFLNYGTSGGNGKVQTEGEYFLFIVRQDSTAKIPH